MIAWLEDPLVLLALVFVAVSCLVVGIAWLWGSGDRRLAERLRAAREEQAPASPKFSQRPEGFLTLVVPNIPPLARWLIPDDGATRTRLQAQLFRAGIYHPSGLVVFSTLKLLAMTGPALAALALSLVGVIPVEHALLAGGALGASGALLPAAWLRWQVARRQRTLRRSLPDFLDLLVACMEGGMGLQAAMVEVARELTMAHPALAAEFNIVQAEGEVGRPIDVALANLAERTDLEELRSLATFAQQAQRYGTSIAEALRQLSDMLRVQREHRAEEAAQKAAVKILVPTLCCIFPTVFVVLAGPAAILIHERIAHSQAPTAPAKP